MKNKICLITGLLLMSASISLYAQQLPQQSYNVDITNSTGQTIQITEGTASGQCVTIDNLSPNQNPYPITVDQSGINIPFSLKANTVPGCTGRQLITFYFTTMDNEAICLPYINLQWNPIKHVTVLGKYGSDDDSNYVCSPTFNFDTNTVSIAVNRN